MHQKPTSLKQFRESMGNALVLSYVQAGEVVYGMSVSKEEVRFKKLGNFDRLSQQIEAYYTALQNTEPLSRFAGPAHQLYQMLIQPFGSSLNSTRRLIISPDPAMQHFPFEALLTSELTQAKLSSGDFRDLPYLLNSHEVSYRHGTGATLSENQGFGNVNFSLVGFAPFSGGDARVANSMRSGLANLPASGQELKSVFEVVERNQGQALGFWSGAATISAFDSTVHQADILHIASHSIPDFEKGNLARIAFKGSEEGEDSVDFIYASDIYGKRLKANLVVLSSCESAAGRVYDGEGVFSLARSFLYAGVAYVIASQWEVPDEHASSISTTFYKHLFDNQQDEYAKALTLAKRELVSNASGPFYHPGYWSNFVLIGN